MDMDSTEKTPWGSEQKELIVPENLDGIACGDFLRAAGVSRRLTAKLKRIPLGISRRGEQLRTVDAVYAGDVIALKRVDETFLQPNGALRVPAAYEDGDVVIFDKPAGMPVHPSAKHREDTLGNCFAAMYPGLTFRPVNRLDRDTSGLCAAAKSAYAAKALSGGIEKVYFAVTEGVPLPKDTGNPLIKWYRSGAGYKIEAPIGRAEQSLINRRVCETGRYAETYYEIVNREKGLALLKIILGTGRTHQIRVHFSAVGHPLAGDDLYGGSRERFSRQALHCGEMSFVSPSTGERVTVKSGLPSDMEIFC